MFIWLPLFWCFPVHCGRTSLRVRYPLSCCLVTFAACSVTAACLRKIITPQGWVNPISALSVNIDTCILHTTLDATYIEVIMKIYLNNREFVLAPFDSSILFLISVPQISQTVWSPHTVERTLQDSCLPFLRSACTMARLVYNINLPEVEVRPSPIVGVKTNAGRESFMTSVSSPLEKRKGN